MAKYAYVGAQKETSVFENVDGKATSGLSSSIRIKTVNSAISKMGLETSNLGFSTEVIVGSPLDLGGPLAGRKNVRQCQSSVKFTFGRDIPKADRLAHFDELIKVLQNQKDSLTLCYRSDGLIIETK